jgi:hypothetical protein
VFLSGPQAGEHAMVLGQRAVMGRSAQADIPLREEAASREQVLFELTPDGWVMENRSSNGTEVNGKRYKSAKKRILLETGDILGVGQETRILYVSPEDDPQEAMAERGLEPVKPAPQAPPPSEASGRPRPEEAMDELEPVEESSQAETADEAEARRKAKTKKYAIFGAIYLALIIGAIVFFSMRGGEEDTEDGVPKKLSKTEIAEVIESRLDVKVQVDPLKAKKVLEHARSHYRNRERIGNLAWAVKYFKLHQEYTGSLAFEKSQDGEMFIDAKRQLVERVSDVYKQAYFSLQRKRWEDAAEGFQRVREMITPFTSQPFPDSDNPIWRNVLRHLRYANSKIAEQRTR